MAHFQSALVQAMESQVESVILDEGVTMIIKALTEYNGHGRSRQLQCFDDTAEKYRERLKTWATSRNWVVTFDDTFLGQGHRGLQTRRPNEHRDLPTGGHRRVHHQGRGDALMISTLALLYDSNPYILIYKAESL